VNEIKLQDLRAYQRHLSRLGRKPATIHRKFHGFSTFWQWAVWEGYAEDRITERIRLPRLKIAIRDWMSVNELKAFLSAPVKRRNPALETRDTCAFALLAWLGLRKSEVLNLRIEDVRFDDQAIIIRAGKGNADRVLPLLPEYEGHLRKQIGDRTEGWVFLSNRNRQWCARGFGDAFAAHLERAGLDGRGYTPHTLRHTFATMMIRKGWSIHLVKEFLGHVNIETTAVYLHAAQVDKVKAFESHFLRGI